MIVSDVLVEVRRLKESAKTHTSFEAYDDALECLEQALKMLEQAGGDWLNTSYEPSKPPDQLEKPYELADEFADCLGMKGGVLRKNGNIQKAIEAYGAGSFFELKPKYRIDKSYNAVNVIKLLPFSGEVPPGIEVPEVDPVIRMIRQQVSDSRQKDRWAWADLGDCYLIKGKSADEANDAYSKFVRLADVEGIDSAHQFLVYMAEEWQKKGDARAVVVRDVIELLERTIQTI